MPTIRRAAYKPIVIPLTARQKAIIARNALALHKSSMSGFVVDALVGAVKVGRKYKPDLDYAKGGHSDTLSLYVELPITLFNDVAAHIGQTRAIHVARYALQVACGL